MREHGMDSYHGREEKLRKIDGEEERRAMESREKEEESLCQP
jgi:hypothetical protein